MVSDSSLQARLERWKSKLSDLPSLQLPTDYPRPTESSKLVEATQSCVLNERLALGLARLALYDDSDNDNAGQEEEEESSPLSQPPATPFHLLLSAFVVLLHRYTGDTDLLIATSSIQAKSIGDPLLLRIKADPGDSFWELVRRIQFLENEAENDTVPYSSLLESLGREEGTGPLFRVRVFDESDKDRAERNFMDQTSSTSDITLFIKVGDGSETPASATTPTTPSLLSSSRSSLVPTISLRIHYNSLLFSQSRISHLLDQISLVLSTAVSKPLSQIGNINLITASQRQILPDPRADLEWNGFRDAITDIFSANATKFPERTCIVESVEGNSAKSRVFTYRQMDKASNILAHALLQNGVEREDVVTVYSTRNVDLVVAVMGILKAGATFSVIGRSARFFCSLLHKLM